MIKRTSPLHIGLIGCSTFAEERLLPALQASKDMVLWSVHSRSIQRAYNLSNRFSAQGPIQSFAHADALLADPSVDAVLIANYDAEHAETAIAAARAGKHLFVEKPFALTQASAEAVARICQSMNVRCMVGLHQRQLPAHLLLKQKLSEHAIGEVEKLSLTWSFIDKKSMPWRTKPDKGHWWVLSALGPHAIDLVTWVLEPTCGHVTSISATINDDVHHQRMDETATISLRFANNAEAIISVSCVQASTKEIEVRGSTGNIVCRNTLGSAGSGEFLLNGVHLPFVPCNPYEDELHAFAQAIRNREDPSPNAEDGVQNTTLLERASASSLTKTIW